MLQLPRSRKSVWMSGGGGFITIHQLIRTLRALHDGNEFERKESKQRPDHDGADSVTKPRPSSVAQLPVATTNGHLDNGDLAPRVLLSI